MSKLEYTESLESLLANNQQVEAHRERSSRKSWIILTYINSFILVVTLVIATTSLRVLQGLDNEVMSFHHSQRQSQPYKHSTASMDQYSKTSGWLSCGNSTEQAMEKGCIFDLMLSTWLHPECYWHDHLTTTSEKANMTYFLDEKMTIPFHEAATGKWPQHYIWTQPSYHALHCTYMWERQIMAWTSGNKIDSRSWSLVHSKHCAMTVLEKNNPYASNSAKLRQGFSDCGKP